MLTILRQACCHPKLIEPNIDLPSAKMQVFEEILQELREGNHRALVFSQFVRYLSIVREKLDKLKVSYQYFDGSTPVKKRRQAVEAFQSGEGDLFLISTKAGGFGLNLTAADYVIHLDPWWNPAVEEQASDRVHRIGQTRPVTVYKIVTQGTVEDKIIKLHGEKRKLAGNVLADTDKTAGLNTKDLVKLLRELV